MNFETGTQRLSSIAIAGAWGYIGRKFLDAAQQLGLDIVLFDPGRIPTGLEMGNAVRCVDEDEFYEYKADLFHLALHPEHRPRAVSRLLRRSHQEPIAILCEKPMAPPESPHQCEQLVQQIEESAAHFWYDFPELFDPITQRIVEFLSHGQEVWIESISTQRSKDREDPGNPRNAKRMVHIQYQESVHCLAFVLFVLAHLRGNLASVFSHGFSVTARAEPYQPPNPGDYPYVVDGQCEYLMTLGRIEVNGRTDFKRGAPWTKRRVICGQIDGRPFTIDANYLEGDKTLLIDGESQDDVLGTNSYVEVLKSIGRMREQVTCQQLAHGIYPNSRFAHITYQLSSVLWRSSWEASTVEARSLRELLRFDAGFSEAVGSFGQYG